jgi:methionyl-tRNA formyltransferase
MGRQDQATAFGVCAVGFKGAEYLSKLIEAGQLPSAVFSYEQKDDITNAFARITELARQQGIAFHKTKHPAFDGGKPLFFVGWQYLIKQLQDGFIVFHDSLLPKYRGFTPTVNALINGETRIGVTAFKPDQGSDTGPILAQLDMPVAYPIRIAQALRQQAALMAQLTLDILSRQQAGNLKAVAQDHATATYSIWRDEKDYRIDWNESAAAIKRTVDALSFPYAGATTLADDRTLVIDEASEVGDLDFRPRHPGKVWRFDEGRPVVICGRGLIRLDSVLTYDGQAYAFERLRTRLL